MARTRRTAPAAPTTAVARRAAPPTPGLSDEEVERLKEWGEDDDAIKALADRRREVGAARDRIHRDKARPGDGGRQRPRKELLAEREARRAKNTLLQAFSALQAGDNG